MKFSVDQQIFEKWPEVKIGIVVLLAISNKNHNQDILNLLREEEHKTHKELEGKDFNSMPEVATWKEVYKQFGSNPREYRSSIEALLRRVRTGNPLPQINNLVDLYNYLSIKYHVPAGAEDLDKVQGNISLSFAEGTENGKYIGSEEVDTCYQGEVIYKDQAGFICRRWNWREGDRTKIDEETQNAVLVFEAMPPVSEEQLKSTTDEAINLIKKYLGGQQQFFVLSKLNPSLEISFTTGKKSAGLPADLSAEVLTKAEVPLSGTKAGVIEKIEKKKKELPPKEFVSYEIISALHKAVMKLWPESNLKMADIHLEHPVEESHGDYATNISLLLTKTLKKKPADIANKIFEEMNKKLSVSLAKIEIAGPGFINFWLSPEYLLKELSTIFVKQDDFGRLNIGKDRTTIVEYSSPNIAKPFTIAHLLSTIIGFSIANILYSSGFKVLRDNHLGDWGTQFGKMIYAIKTWGDEKKISESKNPVKELVALYVKFHEEVDKEAKDAKAEKANLETVEDTGLTQYRGTSLEEKGRYWFKKLEAKDPEARRLWKFCYDLSMKEFNRIYKILGVHFDMMLGESFFEDRMQEILELAKNKGIAKVDRGALVIYFPDNELPPLMILKSDGTTLYQTRDIACDNYRIKTWGKDILIMNEVGLQQQLYWKQVFWAEEMLGICNRSQRIHIGHGTMRLPEGVMSTRKGKIIWLEDVLNEAISRAETLMKNSLAGYHEMPETEKKEVAKALGIGAIKYSQLSQNYKMDTIFTWEKALNLHGNSSAYLQYTFSRARSVLIKSSLSLRGASGTSDEAISMKNQLSSLTSFARNDKLEAEELAILRTLYKFPEVILSAAKNYAPNLICNYLYDLAQKFNYFYDKLPILKAAGQSREVRLKITEATAQVLKNGLKLLGIETPERM